MAIDKEPQNSDSQANSTESEANLNDDKPQPPDTINTIDDLDSILKFKENSLVPMTPQSSSSLTPVEQPAELVVNKRKKRPLWQAWQLWGILLVFCSGGIGYGATSMLLKLPKTQSCSKVFWPIASASIRIYCAQTAAETKEVEGLLSAINLVAVLPENHPLRPEINRNIDKWAMGILEIGEQEFQAGKLKQAVATAKKIPANVSSQELVKEKITNWKSIWSKGEETYAQVEDKLRQAEWNSAFNWAVRLTDSPNQYWATTKYEESINNINVAQEENASLNKAQSQITNGKIDDLILAIDKADDIDEKSYAYDQAQEIIKQGKEKLVNNIEQLIKEQDWQQLLQVSGKIPYSLKLQNKVKDWQILANAGASSQLDTVFGMEEAIEEAEKLEQDSEYYGLGRKLIRRWELEIEDVRHLSKARQLARLGTIANLNKAITEAKLIPNSNPRYREARQEITKWRRQVQIIEDQPILNRARELSYGNNIDAWRRAIAEIKLISRNSPLYSEAQDLTRTWRRNIERVEDQPILNQAEALANVNNYPAAIQTARKIKSGRALYSEARSKIILWQEEIDGQRYLREATAIASRGTPEALVQAVAVARRASARSSVHTQLVQDINFWSSQILSIARQTSNSSLEDAIAIAQQVPSGTTSFIIAQKEIRNWQEELNSVEPEFIPPRFKLEKFKKERQSE